MSWLESMSDTLKAALLTIAATSCFGGLGWLAKHILSRDSLAKASQEWQRLYQDMSARAERAEKKVEELQEDIEKMREQHRSDMDALREELRQALSRVTAIEREGRE